jgi:ribosome biogenesis GTPase / thiamine phosphate phosphatase
VLTPSGALVIDTPGMRELQLWGVEEGVEEAFPDIHALALRCKFTDCGHNKEPGCAVRSALESGELAPERLENYRKLKAEKKVSNVTSEKKPGAIANKPGWRKKQEGQKPFRHGQWREE